MLKDIATTHMQHVHGWLRSANGTQAPVGASIPLRVSMQLEEECKEFPCCICKVVMSHIDGRVECQECLNWTHITCQEKRGGRRHPSIAIFLCYSCARSKANLEKLGFT